MAAGVDVVAGAGLIVSCETSGRGLGIRVGGTPKTGATDGVGCCEATGDADESIDVQPAVTRHTRQPMNQYLRRYRLFTQHALDANNSCWNTNDGGTGGHIVEHYCIRADGRTIADSNAAQHACTCADEDVVADVGKRPLVTHSDRHACNNAAVSAYPPGCDDCADRVGNVESTANICPDYNFEPVMFINIALS